MLTLVLMLVGVPANMLATFITYRDYDFVGEDKALVAALQSRMPRINYTDDELLTQHQPMPQPKPSRSYPTEFNFQPDQLETKRFNISMDYGEMMNVSQTDVETALEVMEGVEPNRTAGGRRFRHGRSYPTDINNEALSRKILNIMKQNIYSVQRRMEEVQSTVKKYQSDVRFRIAYLYEKIYKWLMDLKNIAYHIRNRSTRLMTVIVGFRHATRKHIDITYSIEFLQHLHATFTRNMESIIPSAQIKEMAKLRQMQKDMQKMKDMKDMKGLTDLKDLEGLKNLKHLKDLKDLKGLNKSAADYHG